MLNLVLSLSLSHTGHWKFNMAPHGKELSEDMKKIIVALHKDGVGYKKIAKTLKLSCSTVAKTIQRFNRTGSTQNRPRHGRPKKLSACAQRHIQRLCLVELGGMFKNVYHDIFLNYTGFTVCDGIFFPHV